MPMVQFHETGYGKKFFERQLPMLTKAIEKLAEGIEKQNELEKEDYSVVVQEIESAIVTQTPAGRLLAEVSPDPDYPGIWVTITDNDGMEHNVAIIEYVETSGLRTLTYTNTNEDYIAATRWDQKGK